MSLLPKTLKTFRDAGYQLPGDDSEYRIRQLRRGRNQRADLAWVLDTATYTEGNERQHLLPQMAYGSPFPASMLRDKSYLPTVYKDPVGTIQIIYEVMP